MKGYIWKSYFLIKFLGRAIPLLVCPEQNGQRMSHKPDSSQCFDVLKQKLFHTIFVTPKLSLLSKRIKDGTYENNH